MVNSSAARSGVHQIQVGMTRRVFGAGGTPRDEADRADDENNAGPAIDREVFMKPEAAEKRDDDVAESSGRHHKCEVSPRKRSHVAGEETDEEDDAGGNERIEESMPEAIEMMEVDAADLSHTTGEKAIADRGCEHDCEQNEITLGAEGVLHLLLV